MRQMPLLHQQQGMAAQRACRNLLWQQCSIHRHRASGCQQLSQLRCLAVAAATEAAIAAPPLEQIPRQRGVSDGPWDAADARAVSEALQDSQEASTSGRGGSSAGRHILLGKSLAELQAFAQAHGQPKYRGKQLYDGLLRGAHSVEDIHTVPTAWRARLAREGARSGRSKTFKEVTAADGTRKFLQQLADGHVVETVGIPLDDEDQRRLTCCVSSQVGCPMRCTFCATGKGGFARNLAAHEIVDQVLTVQEHFGTRVSNVVFMGMGEPLLNLRAVTAAAQFLIRDLGIGARHLTISTVGVPNAIGMLAERLVQEQLQVTLAVSLHAPDQALRQRLVPSAKAYPLHALLADCAAFFDRTGRRVTFEYTLLAGVNDSVQQADELARTLRKSGLGGAHVNLIPWNAVEQAEEFTSPSRNRVGAFRDALVSAGVPASIRATRGRDAAAACGQLRNEHQKRPLQAELRQQLA